MTLLQLAYHKAQTADDIFEECIKEQFGKKVNRFDVSKHQFNEKTLEAYAEKVNTSFIVSELIHKLKYWLMRQAHIQQSKSSNLRVCLIQ